MSFVEPAFPAFLLTVWLVYLALPHRGQNVWLLAVSLVFYGWVHPWYAALLVTSASLDWFCALRLRGDPGRAKAWLGLSIGSGAVLLGTFKYFDFFVANVHDALSLVGMSPGLPVLGLALPAGISFYTFQTMAYTIDVYRGQVEPRKNYVDYLLFVTFFPQLVAGPIERAANLLPQVERPRTVTAPAVVSGLSSILWGAVKKLVIADTLAPYVDHVFDRPHVPLLLASAGAFGFMIQILADFSAYTDIARGSARLLGFELMQNFRHPLLARNPTDLWDRWHISFSTWLRDYIYYPASTSAFLRRWVRIPFVREGGLTNQARATLVTMAFSGLWHGAAWHYVAWGLYWGVVQVVWLVAERRSAWVRRHRGHLLNLAWMLPLNLFGNLLFREPSMARLVGWLVTDPRSFGSDELAIAVSTVGVTLFGGLILTVAWAVEEVVLPRVRQSELLWPVAQTAFASAALGAIGVFAGSASEGFVYFAF